MFPFYFLSFQMFQKVLDIDLENPLEPGVIRNQPSWRRLCLISGMGRSDTRSMHEKPVEPRNPTHLVDSKHLQACVAPAHKSLPSAPACTFSYVSPLSLTSALASPNWSGLAYGLWHLNLSFPAFPCTPPYCTDFTFFSVLWLSLKVKFSRLSP